ncbi:hypothetical protein F5H01DRAFT_350588 [Linnemannia elongata]|nr:hypothetical protein F5H01DRAFT_350588 [Linnemannia elongata]
MYAYPRSLLCVKRKKSIVSSPSFLTLALAVPLCLMFEITIHTYTLSRTSFFFFLKYKLLSHSLFPLSSTFYSR